MLKKIMKPITINHAGTLFDNFMPVIGQNVACG